MGRILQRLRETRVLENYSFMTALSILSALIGLIIYPYVIRMTGKEAYGTYVYAFSIAVFFQVIIDFGFDLPCAKSIAQSRTDHAEHNRIVSTLLTLKAVFFIGVSAVFTGCMFLLPFMRNNPALCVITFMQAVATSLFPYWYFQGLQKMKRVTYINLCLRLCTIPLIILFVHSPEDIVLYALIVMASIVIGTLAAYVSIYIDGVRWQRPTLLGLKSLFYDSTPFFATAIAGNLKSLTVKTLIKQYFGVGDVAVYDLAEKIVQIPRLFTQNINNALFPEVVVRATPSRVMRIVRYERIIGVCFAVSVALFSYPAVLILGGCDMMGAVYITILLSTTIYSWLVTGAYLNFVFVPANRYYLITLNQFLALVSCTGLSLAGLLLWHTVYAIALGVAVSGFLEILFCRYMTKKLL